MMVVQYCCSDQVQPNKDMHLPLQHQRWWNLRTAEGQHSWLWWSMPRGSGRLAVCRPSDTSQQWPQMLQLHGHPCSWAAVHRVSARAGSPSGHAGASSPVGGAGGSDAQLEGDQRPGRPCGRRRGSCQLISCGGICRHNTCGGICCGGWGQAAAPHRDQYHLESADGHATSHSRTVVRPVRSGLQLKTHRMMRCQ